MQFEKYTEYAVEQAKKLLAIDSPSGYGYYVTEYLLKEFAALGIPARRTIKGGVIATLEEKRMRTASFWKPTATPSEVWFPRSRKTAALN